MKKIIAVLALATVAAVSMQAQGFVSFSNDSTTKVTTNAVFNGAVTGPVSSPIYYFALYYSTSATSVGGQTAAICGNTNVNYAFSDGSWTLAAYGTNSIFPTGIIASTNANATGKTPVPGLAGGTGARFVVVGWSANIGKSVAAVQSWFNAGAPTVDGWIGQSPVSGVITPGVSTATALFGASAPLLPGFELGRITTAGSPPVAAGISAEPTNRTAAYGSSVSFSVSYSGNPVPTFQWQFNGASITGATNVVLTLTNVTFASAGNYSVALTNSTGTVTSSNGVLTVVAPPSQVVFANPGGVGMKMLTNSAVGGVPTGQTAGAAVAPLYYYALYASTNAVSVSGQTAAILGNASSSYAFNDSAWTLVAYGTNFIAGCLTSESANNFGNTPISLGTGVATAQFVVIGWSANIGANISALQTWFNGGNPASNGWIGQSGVSGAITLGGNVFGGVAPYLQGFTLGLASPNPAAAYAVAITPPLIVNTTMSGNNLKLSWPASAGSYGVLTASSPAGPWSDSGLTTSSDGTTVTATASAAGQPQYFRLMVK